MITANTVTYDAANPQITLPAMVVRAATETPKGTESRVYLPPGIGRAASPRFASVVPRWQVREDGGYYIPDFLSDKDDEGDPLLSKAADADSEDLREAQGLLDEAANLVAVLRASMEQECDARAARAETVLKIVEKKVNQAHNRIDRHEIRHTNLFLAYFDLKARSKKGTE
jgi:hypothetical protein